MGLISKHAEKAAEASAVELFVDIVADLGVDIILEKDTLENAEQRELLEQFYKRIENYAEDNPDRTLRGLLNI